MADNARSACAATLHRIDDAKIATMHVIAPRDREAAIVALSRRPGGRPGPPLRTTAVAMVVGMEEWCLLLPDPHRQCLTEIEEQAQSSGRPESLPIASS